MLPQLHSERQLAAIEAACVPTMTAPSRQSVIQRLSRRAAGAQARARSLHEALGGHARRIDVSEKKKKGRK